VVRRRGDVDVSDFAWNWVARGTSPPWSALDSTTVRTHGLRIIYKRDIRLTIQSLDEIYVGKPPFPSGHWKDVLLGQFVEFEKLNFEHIALVPTKAETFLLGDGLELAVSGSSAGGKSKSIRDFATWGLLWDRYAGAVLFAYPNRKVELNEYKAWLTSYFANTTDPERVINLDKACRRAAAEDHTLALNDFNRLQSLTTRFYSICGIGTGGGESSSVGKAYRAKGRTGLSGSPYPPRGGGLGDICRRWNAEGNCDGGTCRYRHVCLACSGDHRQTGCSNEEESRKSKAA